VHRRLTRAYRLTQTPTTYRGSCARDATAEMGGEQSFIRPSLNGRIAQEAGVRGRLGEWDKSDPLLPFALAPVRQGGAPLAGVPLLRRSRRALGSPSMLISTPQEACLSLRLGLQLLGIDVLTSSQRKPGAPVLLQCRLDPA